ncbi:MAG: quercetin 2,3-dioxygenase [Betaproteobacteria bacterium]|nr:quercetin 2,3-dioxygenase [Betaproteobacteria bacterium]
MKKVSFVQSNNQRHWVGNGFPVRSVFSYNDRAAEFSPFLLLDYAGPATFEPTTERKGVGEHPHRGFETVTIVYDGEVEHRDSTGGGGIIGPGDVQWMTAAGGLVHEEFHGPNFAKTGGAFEMAQLWVNLPAKHKLAEPGYQGIANAQIPHVELPDGAGSLRVIAGDYNGTRGAARTFSPVNVWDVTLKAGSRATFRVPDGYTTAVFVMRGGIAIADGKTVGEADIAVLERSGDEFEIEATADTKLLILNGEPFAEPVVGYGPFVMNSRREIEQAITDFQNGKMGRIAVHV